MLNRHYPNAAKSTDNLCHETKTLTHTHTQLQRANVCLCVLVSTKMNMNIQNALNSEMGTDKVIIFRCSRKIRHKQWACTQKRQQCVFKLFNCVEWTNRTARMPLEWIKCEDNAMNMYRRLQWNYQKAFGKRKHFMRECIHSSWYIQSLCSHLNR